MPKRILRGKVSNLLVNGTLIVEVERTLTHGLLNRTIKRSKKYHVHNIHDIPSVGEYVAIQERSPVSKMKRWELLKSIS